MAVGWGACAQCGYDITSPNYTFAPQTFIFLCAHRPTKVHFMGVPFHRECVRVFRLNFAKRGRERTFDMWSQAFASIPEETAIKLRDACARKHQRTGQACNGCGTYGEWPVADYDNPGVQLKRCGRCKVAHYCGVECQMQDWDAHRFACVPE